MDRFDITYFHGPFEEYILRPGVLDGIVASGMTLLPLCYGTETNKAVLRLLGERWPGVRAIVHDPRFGEVYASKKPARADEAMRDIVEDYGSLAALCGWDIVDEPSAADFPVLGAMVKALRRYSPGLETTVNLFPNYATPAQLGTPDYEEYLERFIREVSPDYLSYDHYHFMGRKDARHTASCCDERERLIREAAMNTQERAGFFTNAEQVRTAALRHGLPAMMIALLTEHGPYRNLTRAELLWESNMCLCYGFKRLSYFTYWEPYHDDFWRWANAMCDTEGRPMPHYYDIQAIAAQLRPVGELLYRLRSAGVWRIGGAAEPLFHSAEPGCGLPALEGDNGVAGLFDDGSVYLVNRDCGAPNRFVLPADGLLRFEPAARRFVPAPRELLLEAGEAALLRPMR